MPSPSFYICGKQEWCENGYQTPLCLQFHLSSSKDYIHHLVGRAFGLDEGDVLIHLGLVCLGPYEALKMAKYRIRILNCACLPASRCGIELECLVK